MISVIKLEKYIVGVSIFGIIISKLNYKKKLCLIILLKVDKNLEIGVYCTILPLSLVDCLRVKSGKEFLFDA